MSLTEVAAVSETSPDAKKRKREENEDDLEINLNAPEPPSKKALRKAKKAKPATVTTEDGQTESKKEKLIGSEDVVPNRGKRSEYGIWIGNLSFSTTKQDLLNFMIGDTEYKIEEEKVTRINLPSGSGKFGRFQNKGFAYIDLADEDALSSALQLSEKLLTGRRVLIKNANSFEGRPKEAAKEVTGKPPSKRIFIGNLDFDTSVDDLEKHFAVCGPIQNTHMATFEDSGKCKGYAWIEFEQLSSGQAAMRGWVEQSSGVGHDDDVRRSKQRIWVGKINGRKLRMEYAEDKTTRYNKRYGKNASQEGSSSVAPPIEEVAVSRGVDDDKRRFGKNNEGHAYSKERQPQSRDGKSRNQRYTEDTVKRLTGAIVESQGQKVTFD